MATEAQLKKRFRLEIKNFTRYPDGASPSRFNVGVNVFDSEDIMTPQNEPNNSFDFDFHGDVEDMKSKIYTKLNEILDEDLDSAFSVVSNIISQYTGVK